MLWMMLLLGLRFCCNIHWTDKLEKINSRCTEPLPITKSTYIFYTLPLIPCRSIVVMCLCPFIVVGNINSRRHYKISLQNLKDNVYKGDVILVLGRLQCIMNSIDFLEFICPIDDMYSLLSLILSSIIFKISR